MPACPRGCPPLLTRVVGLRVPSVRPFPPSRESRLMIWLTVSWRACQTDDDNSTRRRREEKRARRDRARARPALHILAICHLFSMWSVSMANVSSLFNIFSITRHNIWIQIGLRVLVVRAIVLQRALPPSLAICVIYVLTTFFRSLARSSECICTLLRPERF